MTSLSDLREVVDIGVGTHVHTHSSAAVDAATSGVLGEIAVDGTAEGYAQLVELAGEQATLKVGAIEGTGGHGAGLARGLVQRQEIVVELDRPNEPSGATARSPTSRCDPGRSRGLARTGARDPPPPP